MSHNLSERQQQAAADQLLIDERQELINHAMYLHGVVDARGFRMEWSDETTDVVYKMRALIMAGRAYVSYHLSIQKAENEASRLRFDENRAVIGAEGPLERAVRDLSYDQSQIYLGTVLHRALGNLILDGYGTEQTSTPADSNGLID